MTTEIQIPPEKTPGGTSWAPPDKAVDGNGTTHNTVQSAVDEGTGLVLIGPGTFNENVVVPDTTAQEGGFIAGVGSQSLIDGSTDHALKIKPDGMTVQDISVQTTAANGNAASGILVDNDVGASAVLNPRIRNVVVNDSDEHGIDMADAEGGSLTDCVIESADQKGIRANSWNGGTVANCDIGDPSGGVGDDGISITGGDDNIIDGCYISNCGTQGIFINSASNDGTISNCIVTDSSSDGIKVDGNDIVIASNSVTNSGGSDIDVSSATNAVVSGNIPTSANNQGGGGGFAQTTKTSNYTASDNDSVWADSSSSSVTITLPNPSQGVTVRVANIDDTNGVTLSRSGSENINGSASDITLDPNESLTVESDGTNWWIV